MAGIVIGNGSHAQDIIPWLHYPTVYPHHTVAKYHGNTSDIIIAINDPWTRAKVAEEMGLQDRTWFHPDAYVGMLCEWGYGCHINYRTSMTRTRLGNHVTISPGATICGDVVIGSRVLIGAGAVICDRVTIGDDVTIGAGTVILPEQTIPSNTRWVGVPARQLP